MLSKEREKDTDFSARLKFVQKACMDVFSIFNIFAKHPLNEWDNKKHLKRREKDSDLDNGIVFN